MNVLLAVPQYPPLHIGGAELFAQRTAHWLLQHGHQVQIVCVGNAADSQRKGDLRAVDEMQNGVPVQRLYFNWWHAANSLEWTFNNPLIEAQFEALMRAQHFDVMHLISGYLLGASPLRAARRCKVPTVVMLTDFWFACPSLQLLRADGSLCTGPALSECLHCLFVQDRRAQIPTWAVPTLSRPAVALLESVPAFGRKFDLPARVDALNRRIPWLMDELNAAEAIVGLTQFVAQLHANNGMSTERLAVVPDCIDMAEFDLPAQTRVDDDAVRFGYLGQMIPIKGVDLVIRAFRKLNRSRRRARLMLHGNLDNQSGYSRQLHQLAGNDPDIVFAGGYNHRSAMKLLHELDAVVVPSRWYENSPRVILEAFAAARPVVATNLGGISEVVHAEENGLLFERSNVDDLARQMQRLLDNPDLLVNLQRMIPPMRGMDEYMNDLLNVYCRVMHQPA